MKKKIEAIKIGTILNISIDGKLHKKVCPDKETAAEVFRMVLETKANPTQENVDKIYSLFSQSFRVARKAGLEFDVNTNKIYLGGFNTPIPKTLVDIIEDYAENNYPMDAIINFWKLLMVNPDERVRTDLFDFITTHDFVLTSKGYMLVYKSVYRVDETTTEEKEYFEFISNQWLHVKKNWSCSPNKYIVYKNLNVLESPETPEIIPEERYAITKKKTAEKWDETKKNIEILGALGDLYSTLIVNTNEAEEVKGTVHYTDMWSESMDITVGTPVFQARNECDANPKKDCSNGLHVGATKYVETFWNSSGQEKVILACLVNPANVVAVPEYDHSKMRVSEYFPFAIATYEDHKIDIVEQSFFEDDYVTIEEEELQKMIKKVQNNELPVSTAINATAEERPMEELKKILESRLLDLHSNND